MKKPQTSSFALGLGFLLIFIFWLASVKTMAVDTTSPVVGIWEGTLDPGAQPKKRIVLHISAGQDGILSGTIDYPDQDPSGILITAITYKQPSLHLESSAILASYDGAMNQESSEIT